MSHLINKFLKYNGGSNSKTNDEKRELYIQIASNLLKSEKGIKCKSEYIKLCEQKHFSKNCNYKSNKFCSKYLVNKLKDKDIKGNFSITPVDYFLLDAKINYSNCYINNILLGLKIYISTTIKNDINLINTYIKNPKYVKHKDYIKRKLQTLKSNSFRDIYIKYFLQGFIIELIKSSYTDSVNKSKILEQMDSDRIQYGTEINYPLISILNILTHKTEISNETNSSKIDILRSRKKEISGAAYGGNKTYFRTIRPVLEIMAESVHDFGDSRSVIRKKFNSKYRGSWTNEQGILSNKYSDINNIFKRKTVGNWWGLNMLPATSLNIQSIINTSNIEPTLFNKLSLLRELNLKDDNESFQNHMKFFSYNLDKSGDFVQWAYKNSNKKKSKVKDFLTTFKSYLIKDNIKFYVYDTGIAYVNLSEIKDYISIDTNGQPNAINLLTPLCNLWDPATTAFSNFKKTYDKYNGKDASKFELIKNSFINDDTNADSWIDMNDNWRPKRNNLTNKDEGGYNIDFIESGMDDETPILYTLYYKDESESIQLAQGYSVNELSRLIKLYVTALKNKNYDEVTYTKTDEADDVYDKLNILFIAINTVFFPISDTGKTAWETLSHDDIKNRFQIILKILLDMKKSGDWGQINWVKQWNDVNKKEKALFISGDKLCALQSILSSNPTLFGAPRNLTNKIANLFKKDNPLLLGYFSGPKMELDVSYINSELIHSSNLIPELYDDIAVGYVPVLKSYKDILKMFKTKLPILYEEFTKPLEEVSPDFRHGIKRVIDFKFNNKFIKSTIMDILFSDKFVTIDERKPNVNDKVMVKIKGKWVKASFKNKLYNDININLTGVVHINNESEPNIDDDVFINTDSVWEQGTISVYAITESGGKININKKLSLNSIKGYIETDKKDLLEGQEVIINEVNEDDTKLCIGKLLSYRGKLNRIELADTKEESHFKKNTKPCSKLIMGLSKTTSFQVILKVDLDDLSNDQDIIINNGDGWEYAKIQKGIIIDEDTVIPLSDSVLKDIILISDKKVTHDLSIGDTFMYNDEDVWNKITIKDIKCNIEFNKEDITIPADPDFIQLITENKYIGIFRKNWVNLIDPFSGYRGNIHGFGTFKKNNAVPNEKNKLISALAQIRLISNVIHPLEQLLESNLKKMSEQLGSINSSILETITATAFKPKKFSSAESFKYIDFDTIKKDMNTVFDTDLFDDHRGSSERRGRRAMSNMENWSTKFTWGATDQSELSSMYDKINSDSDGNSSYTNYENECILDDRLKDTDQLVTLVKNMGGFIQKVMKLEDVKYMYETIPTIYNTLNQNINDLNIIYGGDPDLDEMVSSEDKQHIEAIKNIFYYFITNHFIKNEDDNPSHEVTDDGDVMTRGAFKSDDSTLNNISGTISKSNYFFNCVLSKLEQVSEDVLKNHLSDEEVSSLKNHISSFDKLNELLIGLSSEK